MANSNKNLNSFFNTNKFLGSYNSYQDIPFSEVRKECCFIGRSNVGKSSLLNAITKTKKLAKTSKTPGRTQSINIFEINKKINIVDLPGYGFAKVSKVTREKLIILIEDYVEHREKLDHIFWSLHKKLTSGGKCFVCELHPHKQAEGSKAQFLKNGVKKELDIYQHSEEDYIQNAQKAGFELLSKKDWRNNNEDVPRLISFLFKKL